MKYKDLLEQHAAAVAEAEGLLALTDTEARDLTDDEEKQYDALADKIKALNADMAKALSVETRRAELRGIATPPPAPVPAARGVDPVTTALATAGPQPKTEFESMGEFLACVGLNPGDQRLASLWRPTMGASMQAATTQTTTATRGGYAIPPAFLNTLLSIEAQGEIIRPRATVLPQNEAPDQTLHIPALDQSDHGESPTVPKVYGGVQVSWISEGAEKPQTDFKLREVTLTPYEVAASLDISDRLLGNWRAAGSVIEGLLRGAMSATHDTAFLNGDGSSKPQGIIGSAATISVTRAAAGSFTYADATGMLSSLLMRGGSEPVWIMNRSTMPKLLQMQDPEGNYIWQPNAREGVPSSLLGYQILWNERSPVLGSTGDVVLADLSKYLILPGSGPFVGASEHVRYRENITVYKCFWNVDGKPWLTQPFMGEDGLTYSPFVRLV